MPESIAPDREAEMLLALTPGVGPRAQQLLLERFGSAARVLQATESELRQTPNIGAKLAANIRAARGLIDLPALLRDCRQASITVLVKDDQAYPELLRAIPDPPGVLFQRGQACRDDRLAVAVVGARRASSYGRNQAYRFGYALAKAGLTVVSGLARGVDEAAHRGAMEGGGRTLAVLASGVSNIYPPEHGELADRVARQGAVISEAPPERPPYSGAFPQRNRLISGLSLAVLVVEASSRSGALITARHALEQGRDVLALPGRVDSPTSRGCHRLIRDGAQLVESVDDILDQLGPLPDLRPQAADAEDAVRHPAELRLNDCERQVLRAIPLEGALIDEVIQTCGLPVPSVLAALGALEMRRLIRRLGGQVVARK